MNNQENENSEQQPAVKLQEIINARQNVDLLRNQIQSGRVDSLFLVRQVDKMADILERIEKMHKQLKQQERFRALYNVSRLLGASLDLQVVLDQVMDAIIQLTKAERGFLMMMDDDGDLRVQAARNLDQQTLKSDDFRFSRTIVNQVLDDGKPILTTDASEDPRFAGRASIVRESLRSIMATPLRARGRVIGVVYVDNRAFAGLFDDDDLAALDAFAGQAAVTLDNARLFAETDQQLSSRLDQLTQLRRIDLQLNATLDPEQAMMYTLEWACRLAQAESGHLGLLEGEPPQIRSRHHHGTDMTKTQPVHLEKAYPGVAEVVRTGKTVTHNGNKSAMSVLIVPILREQRTIGVVILRRDGAFSEDDQDLVERIVTRAAVAIENARLYEAVKAADRAKSEFVGIVAHDLKVPMTSILGYAELTLMMGELAERQREFQDKIRNTVRRMEMLVSDLADISRIESGHFLMNETHVSVASVIQEVKDGTFTQVQARAHTYVEDIEGGLPDMWVDYYRLIQVLTNLVSNAYKYTPDGGTITLRARRAGRRIEFSVIDTGIGLSREAQSMLGTKFWRADDDYTRSQPGTGLGFAITRSLIEQMGSFVKIDSELGKGSAFRFDVAIANEDN